jgi:shikimate kinase
VKTPVNGTRPNAQTKPAPVRRIVLTGFMGSGKSTVGPMVARKLGWRFLDADNVIVGATGMPIHKFFAHHGESAFRERDHEIIAGLATEDRLVLALGGGAIETDATRALLLNGPGTLLVHLEVSLATTLERCRGTERTRPILADQANLAARFDRRLPLYRMAHVSISADAQSPRKIAEAVVRAAGFGRRPTA